MDCNKSTSKVYSDICESNDNSESCEYSDRIDNMKNCKNSGRKIHKRNLFI